MTHDTFRRLPKIDLHRHLEGSLRLDTLWEFHQRQNQGVHASREALEAAYTIAPGERPGFTPFLAKFTAIMFKFGGLNELERVGREAMEDAANDGIVHLELRFSPAGFARRTLLNWNDPPRPQIDPSRVVDATAALVSGAQSEAAKRRISVAFIVTLGRHFGVEVNRPAAELLKDSISKHLHGLDLAGDEAHPAADYAPHFHEWTAAGRGSTVHAGEDPRGSNGAKNIREAIEELKADRIGHGIRAIDDPTLVADLRSRGTVLEVCPTSNLQTHAAADYASHPIKTILQENVRVTINSDDPTVSRLTLSDEFYAAHHHCGLSREELITCLQTAADAAYVSDERKKELREQIARAWDVASK
ncbi:MAG TPA: adenosine deaminase [Planctomycetota bacterium]|nr:adenosine deaminase [Planctomycetota bacterium]